MLPKRLALVNEYSSRTSCSMGVPSLLTNRVGPDMVVARQARSVPEATAHLLSSTRSVKIQAERTLSVLFPMLTSADFSSGRAFSSSCPRSRCCCQSTFAPGRACRRQARMIEGHQFLDPSHPLAGYRGRRSQDHLAIHTAFSLLDPLAWREEACQRWCFDPSALLDERSSRIQMVHQLHL